MTSCVDKEIFGVSLWTIDGAVCRKIHNRKQLKKNLILYCITTLLPSDTGFNILRRSPCPAVGSTWITVAF